MHFFGGISHAIPLVVFLNSQTNQFHAAVPEGECATATPEDEAVSAATFEDELAKWSPLQGIWCTVKMC